MLPPHDDPLVIAGQATCALELVRQMGKELERRPGSGVTRAQLDAVFVVAGGSSLLAGVASVIKSISPHTKVIGVEPQSVDVLRQSLMSGSRVNIPDPSPNPNPNPITNTNTNTNNNQVRLARDHRGAWRRRDLGAAARRGGALYSKRTLTRTQDAHAT